MSEQQSNRTQENAVKEIQWYLRKFGLKELERVRWYCRKVWLGLYENK